VSRAKELEVLRHKYAAVSDPRAKAAIAEYADDVYGPAWQMPEIVHVRPRGGPAPDGSRYLAVWLGGKLEAVAWPAGTEVEGPCPGRRPEHARLLRHIDWLNPKVRRIA
jgi:hypothetical protein